MLKFVLKGKVVWYFETGTIIQTSPIKEYESLWNLNELPLDWHGRLVRITIEEISKDEANKK